MNTNSCSFSISESALNKLPLGQKSLNKSFTNSSNSICGHNSTSSTVDENTAGFSEEKLSPVKRRKLKLKKKVSKLAVFTILLLKK